MSSAANKMPIQILCVDDHPLLRKGIAALIEDHEDMTIVGSATNGREAVDMFARLRPDLTLMDLRMPDMDGIRAITLIRQQFPDARIIVLTTYPGDVQALGALKAGAMSYLLKSSLGTELLDAIRTVHAGKRFIPQEVAAELGRHAADEALTAREIEVLRCAAAGHSNKQIARELGISVATVKSHVRSLLPKLNASDRTHAVSIALKRGIFDL
jgi:DNA-binding NarL/FixJ family response regulator